MAAASRTPKPDPKAGDPVDGVTANGPEVEEPATPAPLDATRLQPNQAAPNGYTTKPARGVNEAPSNTVADEPSAAALQQHVQSVIDDEESRGYRGARRSKPVPNYNYTLKVVGEGAPTPETTVHTPRSA